MNERPKRGGGGRPGGRRRSSGGRGAGGGHAAKPKPRTDLEDLHPVEEVPDIETFTEWELGEDIQQAIRDMNITSPTPIQRLAIGPVLEGKDVIAKAETGTGKTLAFGAPMIARMDPERSTVLGMVLCPTRELAQQVADVLEILGATRNLRVALVVGGDKIDPQIRALQAGAQVIVGTPGRVLDLYNQRFLQFPWTETVVLDEADKMFEIGFIDDIRKILSFTPEERQTLLFSATFPPEVLELAREQTTDPAEVATAKGASTVANIEQRFLKLSEDDCPIALVRLLEQSKPDDVFLVFCERRTDVDRLIRRLERLPFMIKALHGGYDQAARFRVMSAFRTGEVKALIATDVAARGLDVQHVTHVVNFAVPRELEDYTHRIGRTGRAGREGTAITFVTPRDARRWREVTSRVTWPIEEMELPGRGGPRRSRERGRDEERPRRDREEEPRKERSRSDQADEPRDERLRRSEEESSGKRPRRALDEGQRRDRPRRADEPRRERTRGRREEEPREGRPHRHKEGAREEPARSIREADPARERPRRKDAESDEERPRRQEAVPGEERPRRRQEARTEEERPRRERDSGRRERPARDRDSRGSKERDRGQRRERSDREDGRPGEGRSAAPARENEEPKRERPRRESEAPAAQQSDGTPFGWLPPSDDGKREQSRPEKRARREKRQAPAPEPEPEKEVRPAPRRGADDSDAFGAGL